MEVPGNLTLPVLAGDILALRGAGLAAAETWALLCQAAQALQDLFLSNGGVVGGGSRAGPVVTPHTLELTSRGRVMLQTASPETARTYLPPEYRPGREYSDTDSEKMWMYSLGRALLDTTPRAAALTGSVSVSPTSALQSVLAAMTEPDPQRRASLMNLLDVISEYCRTRMLTKPFTLIVMDMYREVVRSPQYAARMRVAYQARRQHQPYSPYVYHYYYNYSQNDETKKRNNNEQLMPLTTSLHYSKQQIKANLYKCQSRNSRSHPNLSCLLPIEPYMANRKKHHYQSEINIKSNNSVSPTMESQINHTRTYSQPIYPQCSNDLSKIQSSRNLAIWNENKAIRLAAITSHVKNSSSSASSDPIYAFPVKPFLSSQDVRVNGLIAKRPQNILQTNDVYAQPLKKRNIHGASNSLELQPDMHIDSNLVMDITSPKKFINPGNEDIHQDVCCENTNEQINLFYRQYPHPQLPIARIHSRGRESDDVVESPSIMKQSQQNLSSSIITDNAAQSTTVYQPHKNNDDVYDTQPPPKPPRIGIRNGPRARRGKPVQRSSSRLYRAITGPIRSLNKVQCVGPEFVVRASQPPKLLKIGDIKDGDNNGGGRIVVILLSGQRIDVVCNPHKITSGELFQAIIRAENLDDNFTLGLAALLAGDFAMLPPDTRLSKVSPPGWLTTDKCKGPLCLPTSFMLYLRQRFFLPSLRGIRSWISKHLLYLQIRRCILEQQLICSLNQLINLTGLALQAEFGNYNINEHARGNYFLLEHYIPEIFILNNDHRHPHLIFNADELRSQLHLAHRNRRGLDTNTAEELFITHAQELEDYGLHLYIATTDTKELEKTIARLDKYRLKNLTCAHDDTVHLSNVPNRTRDIAQFDNIINCSEMAHSKIHPQIPRETYSNIEIKENIYAIPKYPSEIVNDVEIKNSYSSHNKINGSKKTESNIWLGIHGQGIKLFERADGARDVTQLIRLEWQDIKTLSYSKSSLIIHTKYNGKKAKLKLNMEHKKSYYAFKLTSLHHQFFLKLRSELTSLQGLTRIFGVPLDPALDSSSGQRRKDDKVKISVLNEQLRGNEMYTTSLEDYQNKENENPVVIEKITTHSYTTDHNDDESVCYTPEDDALYAQVNARLEPEGASRDTEEETERTQIDTDNIISSKSEFSRTHFNDDWSSHEKIEIMSNSTGTYDIPKQMSSNNSYHGIIANSKNPEALYAAIDKTSTRCAHKTGSHAAEKKQTWSVRHKDLSHRSLSKNTSSSLPNYGTSKSSADFRTPSLPRRLGVKMGTRAIYSSSHIPKDYSLSDDIELLSIKSETASSVQSTSAQSNDSPLPEAYVLNADVRADDETFCISNDDTMSASLMARLEELSFAEERVLRTIRLERGHGGSIGLQVTEGNDGGVYVQAISVGGSADMAGNVTKGDKIVAINGVSLLNHRYQEALKMLQSSSCQVVELVLSQTTSDRCSKSLSMRNDNIGYTSNIPSSTNNSCSTVNWRSPKVSDVVPVSCNTVSTGLAECYTQSDYEMDVIVSPNSLNSANSNMSNAFPPVPIRHKKQKAIMMLHHQKIVHKSNDNNKVDVTNNDCVPITSNNSEIRHTMHDSFEATTESQVPFIAPKMDGTSDVIGGMARLKHNDGTSNEKLSDHSVSSVVDKKTEITDDLAIEYCDTSNKYVGSTPKITEKPRIIDSAVKKKQTRLDKNFVCAITSSINSGNGSNLDYMDRNDNNNNNYYDYDETNNNSKPIINITYQNNNNNDNNMIQVNVYASPEQVCYNAISSDKDEGRIEKCVKIYKSYKDKMMLMCSEKIYRDPRIADGHDNECERNNEIDGDVPIELSKHPVHSTSDENRRTTVLHRLTVQQTSDSHSIINCNTNPLNFTQNSIVGPVTPCLKTPTQMNQRNNRKKCVKFDSHSDTLHFADSKKLKRKAPLKPITQEFQVHTGADSQQIINVMNNDPIPNQIIELKTMDRSNIAESGEEAFVSTVVGGPSLPYSHSFKNDTITEEEKHDVELTPIIVKSKINARDITKYFNYPNVENRCGHDVNDLQSIVDETMGSNFSRHHGKGLAGRRTQSSGNLCDPQGKLNDVSKMFVPCSNTSEPRYNITGSLPNNLDNDNQSDNIDDLLDNNNIVSGTTDENLGDTLTYTKPYHQVKFYDRSTIGMELVKYHSHDSLKGDPWKYQHNSDTDAVRFQHDMGASQQGSKTLPVRRIDPKWCDPRSIRAVHQKHSIGIVDGHQSDCHLLIHRQRERLALANSKPLIAGEHHNQDQGYASERSPEDEHPPLLSDQSTIDMNSGCTFRIILHKSSRGLGLSVSGGGTTGPVRVKRLFPQQPAALSNQLKPGDILLAANGIPLSGLTNYEALEVLRTTSSIVELLVCRPVGETSITPPGDPPTPPARRKPPSSTQRFLNPIPPLHIEPCGEFDIEMTKVDGSLGFTLRKVDSSALGHYIRALVREPALSDGRIQPGDKIVAVDNTLLSPMSHEEAVSLLRQCGPKVKLRLYRDLAQTPVSALSPTEPDHPLRPSHTSLRQEAVDMLCDLAVRKLSPTTSNGSACQLHSGALTTSPRRLRKPLSRTSTTENNEKESTGTSLRMCAGTSSNDLQTDESVVLRRESQSQTEIPLSPHSPDTIKPSRPRSLHLPSSTGKIEFPSDFASNSEGIEHEEPMINTTAAAGIAPTTTIRIMPDVQDHGHEYQYHSMNLSMDNIDDDNLSFEPASMPPLISSSNTNGGVALNHQKPVYRSAKQTSRQETGEHLNCARSQAASFFSDHDIPAKISSGVEEPVGTKGLLKWKGVMFESNGKSNDETQIQPLGNGQCNEKMDKYEHQSWQNCEVFMVELTRGWNSRLGFSLQSRDNTTIISMVHPDSVAAKDGRLKQGDILIKVNDENVENLQTSDIIDLLRRIRGSIGITVARRKIRTIDT